MLEYPDAYIAYLVEFHATRDYFECHELLEEYWKDHRENGSGDLWAGLIQLAVGQYHERRGNQRGASKLYKQAMKKLNGFGLDSLGLDKDALIEQLANRIEITSKGSGNYQDICMVITDQRLMSKCKLLCDTAGLKWGIDSPCNDSIIHRHKLRDRSKVVMAREEALRAKKEGNRT